jgi:hypothetical protein
MTEYILIQDNDCHWYVIPYLKMAEWSEWVSASEDDHWIIPDWAVLVNGNPSLILFKEFRIL